MVVIMFMVPLEIVFVILFIMLLRNWRAPKIDALVRTNFVQLVIRINQYIG